MNNVQLIGNIAKELELKKTATGRSVCYFPIAVNEAYGDKQITTFVNCQVWEKLADILCQYQKKGNKILVEGNLRADQYEKDGKKMTSMYVKVNSIEFLTKKEEDSVETKAKELANDNNARYVDIKSQELPFD